MKTLIIFFITVLFSACNHDDKSMINEFLSKEKYVPSQMPSPLWYQAELRFIIDSMKSVAEERYTEGYDAGFSHGDWFIKLAPSNCYQLDSGQVIGSFNSQTYDKAGRCIAIQHFIIYWAGHQARQRKATPDEVIKYKMKPENGAEVYNHKIYPTTI